jgi:hypothetical protein
MWFDDGDAHTVLHASGNGRFLQNVSAIDRAYNDWICDAKRAHMDN